MRSSTRPRVRAAVALVAGAAALLAGSVGTASATGPARATSAAVATSAAGTTVLTPDVLPATGPDLANPLRGQYRWMGYGPQPASWPATDLYERDRSYWGRLEPTRGAYDFSTLDAGLADVGATRAKFGFRVMAYCPGCWMESRPDLPPVVPSWMPRQPGTAIPAWNDESFLRAWEDLMTALGARYDADPRLGYVDVGGFGAYGEWADAGERVTDANALRMIDAVAAAFPHHHVLMSAVAVYTQPTVLRRAVDRWATLGLRSDCLGQTAMQVPEAGFENLWKTRPFFTEWCTGADPATGRDQVRAHHVSTTSSHNMRLTYDQMSTSQKAAYEEAVRSAGYRYAVTSATVSAVSPGQPFQVDLAVANSGSAPTYDPWDVRLVLADSAGVRVAALPLGVDLRTALPGTQTFTRTLTAPAVAPGDYRVSVEVRDPADYSAPMRLANASRAADGSYPLGTVALGVPPASSWPRDVTGDRAPDVLAVEARGGALRVYPTSGSGSWRAPIRQGSGWTGYAKVLTAGTWDADAVSDVLVQTRAGGLYLRRGER